MGIRKSVVPAGPELPAGTNTLGWVFLPGVTAGLFLSHVTCHCRFQPGFLCFPSLTTDKPHRASLFLSCSLIPLSNNGKIGKYYSWFFSLFPLALFRYLFWSDMGELCLHCIALTSTYIKSEFNKCLCWGKRVWYFWAFWQRAGEGTQWWGRKEGDWCYPSPSLSSSTVYRLPPDPLLRPYSMPGQMEVPAGAEGDRAHEWERKSISEF